MVRPWAKLCEYIPEVEEDWLHVHEVELLSARESFEDIAGLSFDGLESVVDVDAGSIFVRGSRCEIPADASPLMSKYQALFDDRAAFDGIRLAFLLRDYTVAGGMPALLRALMQQDLLTQLQRAIGANTE